MNSDNITFRRTQTTSEPMANVSEVLMNQTIDESDNSLPDTSIDSNNEEVLKLKERINKLELELKIAHQEIESLSTENNKLKTQNNEILNKAESCGKKNRSPESSKNKARTPLKKGQGKAKAKKTETPTQSLKTKFDSDTKCNTGKETHSKCSKKVKSPKKRKLHIISNCNYIGALENIDNTFRKQFDFFHFVSPGSGLKEILSDMNKKVQNLTINDYCMIMIGEKDFRSSEDYIELVKLIRQSLKPITHTNIIICCPTYVRGSLLHNYRVELFNHLLYLDIMNNEYAYFFDTNLDLPLDMFSNHTGKLNKLGTKRVFENIFDRLIIDIQNYPFDSDTIDTSNNSDFFRIQ